MWGDHPNKNFTDHSNIVWLEQRATREVVINMQTAQKLARWLLTFVHSNLETEHVAGEDNLGPDWFTRGGAPRRKDWKVARVFTRRAVAETSTATTPSSPTPTTPSSARVAKTHTNLRSSPSATRARPTPRATPTATSCLRKRRPTTRHHRQQPRQLRAITFPRLGHDRQLTVKTRSPDSPPLLASSPSSTTRAGQDFVTAKANRTTRTLRQRTAPSPTTARAARQTSDMWNEEYLGTDFRRGITK